MFKNTKINEIFYESINKLNYLIEKLDTDLGLDSRQDNKTSTKIDTKTVEKEQNNNSKIETKTAEKEKKNNTKNTKADSKNDKDENLLFNEVDFRVGKVVSVSEPKDSDKLYLLKVDLGEGTLRDIGTGLRKDVPRKEIENSFVIVWANLKPKKLIGGILI